MDPRFTQSHCIGTGSPDFAKEVLDRSENFSGPPLHDANCDRGQADPNQPLCTNTDNQVNQNQSQNCLEGSGSPVLGFFAGWALLVASAVFMVSGTIPAATATLSLIAPQLADNTQAVTFVAAGWLLAVSAVIVKGIKPTSYSQIVMTGIEIAILAMVVVVAVVKFAAAPAHPFSWKWFSLAEFTPRLFATGALTSLFFFWGWDVTVNLNEETKDSSRAPGWGALGAMLIVLLLFISFATVSLLVLTDKEMEQSGTNIVLAIAEKLFPKPWSYMAVVAVMLSSVGTLETSILQFTRTMYAKGR
ncbi:MAG: hypothetical protein B7X10_06430, partial [Burkholderiales bacterium 21-58-4]